VEKIRDNASILIQSVDTSAEELEQELVLSHEPEKTIMK
jgi:hypothetical protein